ncbi:hypothetical protein SDC9_62299 [bioreactor metagenome]|uniref:DUF2169 domain-containing protein n=1 Tax=bioreactor metagenome TaxID=1076179 RepID=A0A644XIA4_9ZZZZ
MEFVCSSNTLRSDYFVALDTSGREHLVVIAKASWRIPHPGQRPRPLYPTPFCDSDEYFGAPGESAIRYGDDHVRYKSRCDVIFDACAYAPERTPVKELTVGIRVGSIQKVIRVIGKRIWRNGVSGFGISDPEPFERMPLHFGHAFGGVRYFERNDELHAEAQLSNPAGIGWAGPATIGTADGTPAANLESINERITFPDDRCVPIALSAVGRHWLPRAQYAGTFDDRWRKEQAPFLPEDFDERFYQCAPADQQIPYPKGGETVQLVHLTPEFKNLKFQLPRMDHMKIHVLRSDLSIETHQAVADTLFFEVDLGRFSVVWRASTPIRRRIQEFTAVVVGNADPHWWKMKRLGLDAMANCVGCRS